MLIFENKDFFYSHKEEYGVFHDSVCFGINPFYITNTNTAFQISEKLSELQVKMQNDTTLKCKVEINYGMLVLSMMTQAYLNIFLDNLKAYIKKDILNRFSFEVIIENRGYRYKSFELPELSASVSTNIP